MNNIYNRTPELVKTLNKALNALRDLERAFKQKQASLISFIQEIEAQQNYAVNYFNTYGDRYLVLEGKEVVRKALGFRWRSVEVQPVFRLRSFLDRLKYTYVINNSRKIANDNYLNVSITQDTRHNVMLVVGVDLIGIADLLSSHGVSKACVRKGMYTPLCTGEVYKLKEFHGKTVHLLCNTSIDREVIKLERDFDYGMIAKLESVLNSSSPYISMTAEENNLINMMAAGTYPGCTNRFFKK